jgi:hypothetical protein
MTEEQWSDLEELLEFADDPADIDVGGFDGSESYQGGSIAERWINGKGSLHVHLRVRPRIGEAQADNLCLAFVRKHRGTDVVFQEFSGGIPSIDRRNMFLGGEVLVPEKGTVLVDVRQLAHDSKEGATGIFSAFPAFVWLLSFDEFPGRPVNLYAVKDTSFGFAGVGSALELSRLLADRESVEFSGPIAFFEHQLPDDMVQSTPQVMDNIPTDESETRRRRLVKQWADRYGVPRAVKGVIGDGSLGVRLDEGLPFSVERVEVFFSPFQLETRAIKGRTHD